MSDLSKLPDLEIPTEAAEKILAAHPDPSRLLCWAVGPFAFVLRRPDGPAWLAYKVRSRSQNSVEAARAAELMARELMLYPSVETLDSIAAEYPAVPDALGGAVVEAAAGGFDMIEKKLSRSSSSAVPTR